MKKLILITLATLMLTACQPTPEQNIVVEKDTDRMVEQAMPDDTQQAIPTISELVPDDRYVYEETGADDKLTLTTDAEIVVPNVDYMPIYTASIGIFTQEQVTGMFNYLFPDEKPYVEAAQVETKETIERDIIALRQEIANTDDQAHKDDLNEQIKMLEEFYESAPDTQPEGGVSDGTLHNQWRGYRSLWVKSADEAKSFNISTNATVENNDEGISANFHYQDNDRYYSTRNETEYTGSLSEEAQNTLTISGEDALNICRDFLDKSGFNADEFVLKSTHVIDDTGADEIKGENYAYKLEFLRSVDGLGVYSEPGMGRSSNRTEDFAFSWGYESIEFLVDDEGIANIHWDNPIVVGQNITDKTNLLPFEQIKTTFENILSVTYEGLVATVFENKVDMDITVMGAELTLMRIREMDEQTQGIILPVWVFTGQVHTENDEGVNGYMNGADSINDINNSDEMPSGEGGVVPSVFEMVVSENPRDVILLAINAVDGSIIDITKGY